MADKIRPGHYKPRDGSTVDCSRAQQAGLGKAGYQAYLAGCAAKYLWRFPEKNGREDLHKCIQILNMLLDTMSSPATAKDSEEKAIPEKNLEATKPTWQEYLTRYLKDRTNQLFTVSCLQARLRRRTELRQNIHFWLNEMHRNGTLQKHTNAKGKSYFGFLNAGVQPVFNYT